MKTTNKKPTIDLMDEDFGAVLNCAVRYSLGRETYMPHLVIDFILPLLPYISNLTLRCLERDIKEAEAYGYGDPTIDEPHWIQLLQAIHTEIGHRERMNINI